MIKPKLYVFNTARDLLTTHIEYRKHYHEKTGRPGDIPLGGLITVKFAAGHDDDVLLRWITHSEEGELCTLTKGKIVFYYADGFGEKLCEYRFIDAGLIYWKETFDANGPEPMTVTMTISAAIQEFRGQTLIKHWQERWLPPSEQPSYQMDSVTTPVLTKKAKEPPPAKHVLYKDTEAYKEAIKRGEKDIFYLGKHKDIEPRPTGVQSHHGVNSVWMDANFENYNDNLAPTIYMINRPKHNATRSVFPKWKKAIRIKQGLKKVDWKQVSESDILGLAEIQFNAAKVPEYVRKEYFKLFNEYLATLIKS